jgi:hypothetical protein
VGGEKVKVGIRATWQLLQADAPQCCFLFSQVSSHSHDVVIRVYDEAGNVIETHEEAGDFKEW